MVVVIVMVAGCEGAKGPRCEDSIGGVWRSGQIVDSEEIGYHFIAAGGGFEGYPTFRDVPAEVPPGVTASPGMIVLKGRSGSWARRYELGGERCVVSAKAEVTCDGPTLRLELGGVAPPTDWTTCASSGAGAQTLILHR